MNFNDLKPELKSNSVSDILNKYILGGEAVCFNNNKDLIIGLKRSISEGLDIHVKNMEIVGSAILGISLSNERLGKPYDKRSDIDLVIVSNQLLDIAWHELLSLSYKWYKLSEKEIPYLEDCNKTINKGFISPE